MKKKVNKDIFLAKGRTETSCGDLGEKIVYLFLQYIALNSYLEIYFSIQPGLQKIRPAGPSGSGQIIFSGFFFLIVCVIKCWFNFVQD